MRQSLYAAVFMGVLSLPVCAQDTPDWTKRAMYQGAKWNCEHLGACYQYERMRGWRYRHEIIHRERDRYQSYDWRPRSEGRYQQGMQCQPSVVTALSSAKHKLEQNAITDAWRVWMESIAYDGGGTVYMNPENSVNRRVHCEIVEVGAGFVGAISRVGGKFLNAVRQPGDQTATNGEGRSVKCRIYARACRTPSEAAETPQDAADSRREDRQERRERRRERR